MRTSNEYNAPVVTGLYALRHGTPVPNLFHRRDTKIPGVGQSWSWTDVKRYWGQTVEVSGGCMGCLLIDRSALEGFSFILDELYAPDVPLMRFFNQQGIKQMARLDVVCGHEKLNGETIYPDASHLQGYRIDKP